MAVHGVFDVLELKVGSLRDTTAENAAIELLDVVVLLVRGEADSEREGRRVPDQQEFHRWSRIDAATVHVRWMKGRRRCCNDGRRGCPLDDAGRFGTKEMEEHQNAGQHDDGRENIMRTGFDSTTFPSG